MLTCILRDTMKLIELRNSNFNYLRKQFPDWPEYVVRELVYNILKRSDDLDYEEHIQFIKKEFENITWQLERIRITLGIFDEYTQAAIRSAIRGETSLSTVPNDDERHNTQQRLIQLQGVSKEPIIAKDTPDGLLLYEGYHRTIQNLKAYPKGYVGPIYIGYSN